VRLAAAVALTAAIALAFVAPVGAHVTAVPTFVTAGQRETVTLVAPNERQETMTGLSVTVPARLSIVEAVPPGAGWEGVVEDETATWTGGRLVAGRTSSFSLVLEATGEPGDVTLETHQHYPDGGHVRWDVPFTILPGTDSSRSLGTALVVGVLGLVVIATLAVVVWLRRARRSSGDAEGPGEP
jgi:uncharacterized protein YcnI